MEKSEKHCLEENTVFLIQGVAEEPFVKEIRVISYLNRSQELLSKTMEEVPQRQFRHHLPSGSQIVCGTGVGMG